MLRPQLRLRKSGFGLLVIACAMCVPNFVWADQLTVCPVGCDYVSIQGAVNAAADGDEVVLATTLDHVEADIVVFNSVTVSGLPGQFSVLKASENAEEGAGRVFTVLMGAELTLRDLLIVFGDSSGDGGAIYNQGLVELFDTTIQFNRGKDGGGVYNEGTLRCFDCQITDNEGARGGGIYNASEGLFEGFDCSFLRNESAPTVGDGQGGNIANIGVSTLNGCNVSDGVVEIASFSK